MIKNIAVDGVEALTAVVPAVIEALHGRKKIALYGEMGAGKTTFVRAFCAFMKVLQQPASPTYGLVNEYSYNMSDGNKGLIRHLDLFRLKTADEALDIGIEDMLYDAEYCIIEWPQVIAPLLPDDAAIITITITSETTRTISI